MEKKENYIRPAMEIVYLTTENVIASSIKMMDDEEVVNGPARSKRIWD